MHDDTIEHRIQRILADVLELDSVTVDQDISMDNTESWDSLNHIHVVFALEEEFGIVLEIDEIESMLSFFDVLQIVESKL